MEGEPNVMLADLFDQVRADLEGKSLSPSVEFALFSSPLPICINSEASQGLFSGEKQKWFIVNLCFCGILKRIKVSYTSSSIV